MTAVLSPCGLYRYRLERTVGMVGPVFAFFGINPSTADATEDDPTVRKWTGFTKTWGGSRFIVGNAWPLRATDVRALASATRWKHIDRENWSHLLRIVEEADVLVPCWGDRGKVPKSMHPELDRLRCWLVTVGQASGKPVRCFGLTKGGDPMHPLMLPYSTPLQPLQAFAGGFLMRTLSIDIMLSKPGIYVLVSTIGVSLCEVDRAGKCHQLDLNTHQPDGELQPGRWNPQSLVGILGPFARQPA